MIQIDINMPIGCIYEGNNGKTEYCPLCNHDDVPYCQYLDDDEAAIGIDERPCYCPLYKPEPHWIPNTKETVPKDPLRKQIQLKNGWIITGWFDGEDWLPVPEVGAGLLFDNVLAWCELPSPYHPESEE